MKLIEQETVKTIRCVSHAEMLGMCRYMEKLGWKSETFDSKNLVVIFKKVEKWM